MDKKKMSSKDYKTSFVVEKDEKSNDVRDLVDPDTIDEVISTIAGGAKDPKQDKFLLYYMLGYTGREAGLAAGYSPSYSTTGILQTLRKSDKLKKRLEEISNTIPEKYRSWVRLRLSKVAQIDDAVMDRMLNNPEEALRHPGILKQLKQTSGVLEDEIMTPPTINIKNLTLIQTAQRELMEKRLSEMGEVVEVTPTDAPEPIEDQQEED